MKSFPLLLASIIVALPLSLAAPLDEFAAGIENDLDGRSIGYGYAIFQQGNFVRGGGGGIAQPGVPFDENTVKDCHSLSKTITAAAMLQALSEGGVSLFAPMWLYLPKDIQDVIPPGSQIFNVTFDNLLQHRSGFTTSMNTSWAQVKNQIQAIGGTATPNSTYRYSNLNYALCRLVMAYVLNEPAMRSMEVAVAGHQDGGIGFLNTVTATVYSDYVQKKVFAPAGLGTIHPRPVDATLPVFARYYDFSNLSAASQFMPDHRLTVGSEGWALSARQYGQFISALFREKIITGGQLSILQANDRGMFARTGSNGTDTYYNHSGSITIGGVGGRSIWMAFPGDLQVVVQANSNNSDFEASGRNLAAVVREAYEDAYSTPPSSLSFPLHILFHREGDGWITSRGIGNNGNLGARNFDYNFPRDGAPKGMTIHRFLAVQNQAFLLRYSPHDGSGSGNGRAAMHPVNSNGTIASEVFTSANWLPGYTHILSFGTPNGVFLLLHNAATGRIRTVPVNPSGTLNAAVTDSVYTSNFDVAEILTLAGIPHLLRHNSTTGHTHLRVLNADGSVGSTAYDEMWPTGFADWEIYQVAGSTYLLRYNAATGAARINWINGSLANAPQIFSTNSWNTGLTSFRFFEIGAQAYLSWYSAATGAVVMQQVNSAGLLDNQPSALVFTDTWLKQSVSSGVADPARTGWTGVEIYDATPGIFNPNLGLNTPPKLPSIEATLSVFEPKNTKFAPLAPAIPSLAFGGRGRLELSWPRERDVIYLVEESTDLHQWLIVGVVDGSDDPFVFLREPGRAGSEPESLFFRIRSMPDIPPLEVDPTGP
jgi:CubicO group peptidase (beta-lactamase class C family)